MNPKSLILAGALAAGLVSTVFATSETSPAVPATSPASAAAPATPSDKDELGALVKRIQAKLRSGPRTEEALAAELKEFEALYGKQHAAKSPVAPDTATMRGMLYFQVFEQADKAEAILREAQKEYPDSQRLTAALAHIDAQKESEKAQAGLKVGAQFPDFQEKDLSGAPLSVARFKGKVVLVDFWAVWCGPCVAELPNVLAAYEKYHDKGFEIIGISLDQNEQQLKSFMADRKMTWPQYFDGKGWSNKLATQYGIRSIPATFLLDRDGKIVAKGLRGDALEKELERLLGK